MFQEGCACMADAHNLSHVTREFAAVMHDGRFHVPCDTLVGVGMSGAIVVPHLAEQTGKQWMILRKPGDHHKTGETAEGVFGREWLFVDDRLGTGATYRRARQQITALARQHGNPETFRGMYLYGSGAGGTGRYFPPRHPLIAQLDSGRSMEELFAHAGAAA